MFQSTVTNDNDLDLCPPMLNNMINIDPTINITAYSPSATNGSPTNPSVVGEVSRSPVLGAIKIIKAEKPTIIGEGLTTAVPLQELKLKCLTNQKYGFLTLEQMVEFGIRFGFSRTCTFEKIFYF